MNLKTDEASNLLGVRLEQLPPMRVARFPAFGRNPEQKAWAALCHWAQPQKLLDDTAAHPVFGFNNPGPAAPGADYGYEFWISLGLSQPSTEGVELVDFPGGWYAVLRQQGPPTPQVWMKLVDWAQRNGRHRRKEHELERLLTPSAPEAEMVFELCLPIEPPAPDQRQDVRVRGVDFILYPVSDLAKAAQFYRETLGLRQEMLSEQWQWAEFSCGNVTLALKGGETSADRGSGPRLALAVEDVHSAWVALKNSGARLLGEPVDYGVCCAVEILDPDGNVVILHKRADGTWG